MSLSKMPLSPVSRDLRIIKRSSTGDEVLPLPDDSTKFDVISFKVYNTELGTYPVHDLFPPNSRQEFRFDAGLVLFPGKDGGEKMRVVGSLPLLLAPGAMAPQDMDGANHAQAQAMVDEWLKKAGVAEDSPLFKKVTAANIPFGAAFFCPGMNLVDAQELLLIELISLVLGDSLDQYPQSGIDYDEFTEAVKTICSVCLGEDYDAEFEKGTKFPHCSTLSALCAIFREMITKLGLELCAEVLKDLVEYIEMHAWEMDKWWEECDSHKAKDKDLYFYRKEITHGLKMKVELFCVYRNVVVTEKVRRDPLFTLLKRQWTRMCLIAEAILFVHKDIEAGSDDNCFLMRTRKRVTGVSLEKTLEDIRACVRDCASFESQLNMKFEDTPGFGVLQEYYQVGKAIVDAQYQYLTLSGKHGEVQVVVEVIYEAEPEPAE